MNQNNTKLLKAIDETIRPQLASHGGDISVVSVSHGVLRFRLIGGCAGCPSAGVTAESLVAQAIIGIVPEIEAVELVQGVSENLLDQARAFLAKAKNKDKK